MKGTIDIFTSVRNTSTADINILNGSMYKNETCGKNIHTAYNAPTDAEKHNLNVGVFDFEKTSVNFRIIILIIKFIKKRESAYTIVFIGSPLYKHYMQ